MISHQPSIPMTKPSKRSRRIKPKTAEPIVNAYTARHGDYRNETMSATAGEFDDGSQGQIRILRNRGGSTLQRWLASGLEPTQARGIEHYTRAYRLAGFGEGKTTANLSGINAGAGCGEERINSKLDAMETLKRLDERIFNRAPPYYRDVWQNIVIFGAGPEVAGGSVRSAGDRAKQICMMIADMICNEERL